MIVRGDLWWADLGEPKGSAPRYWRPALVVSSDAYNRSRIRTVLCVAVTSNLRLAEAPGNVLLPKGAGSLPKVSVANVSQVLTLDKDDLESRIGALPVTQLRLVESGLRQVLGLSA